MNEKDFTGDSRFVRWNDGKNKDGISRAKEAMATASNSEAARKRFLENGRFFLDFSRLVAIATLGMLLSGMAIAEKNGPIR